MRDRHIVNARVTGKLSWLLAACCSFAFLNLTCNGDGSPTVPEPVPYDPSRPTIDSFTAQRNGATIDDDIVYSGEDIGLVVRATSHALPRSCGLDESETVEGNLLYTFTSAPPDGVPAPGLISQASPPDDRAVWRVPILDDYDTGDGVLYVLKVRVYDECLGNQANGSQTLRAFADQGSPTVSATRIESWFVGGSPAQEDLDPNGYYEVEKGNECRITVTAQSRTSGTICANRGVPEGDELRYEWSSSYSPINLSHDQDPPRASVARFDIPAPISVGDTFQIVCDIVDACTGTASSAIFRFRVVGKPGITSLDANSGGNPSEYDPYFDTYVVRHGQEIILTASGETLDADLCDLKGISPDLEWSWEELGGSIPSLAPQYNPFPVPNSRSTIQFVVPAASNGTEYSLECTLTDRCNGLTDSEIVRFLVIVPPDARITFVKRGTTEISPSQDSGRYEVGRGDTVTVRITSDAKSGTGFCEARGVSMSPPVQYYWIDPWGDLLILNYEAFPTETYSDLVIVVPAYAPPMNVNLTCRVKDLCNKLVTQISVPFRILASD